MIYSDSLLSHQSTFYTELIQTHSLLTTSSKYSLAIIDELGRGTSTYDGAAIAYIILKEKNHWIVLQCWIIWFNPIAPSFSSPLITTLLSPNTFIIHSWPWVICLVQSPRINTVKMKLCSYINLKLETVRNPLVWMLLD